MKLYEKILIFCVVASLIVFAFSCNSGDISSAGEIGDDCDDPPDPHFCTQELEPNDHFDEANFIDVLPILSTETVCGDLFLYPPHDADTFHYYISLPEHVIKTPISIVITTDVETTPKLRMFQTIHDSLGNPTGNYMLLGQWVQDTGMLFVDSFMVPHDILMNNDLYMVVEAHGPPYHLAEYKLEYWSN